jgi:hypothetical protein
MAKTFKFQHDANLIDGTETTIEVTYEAFMDCPRFSTRKELTTGVLSVTLWPNGDVIESPEENVAHWNLIEDAMSDHAHEHFDRED